MAHALHIHNRRGSPPRHKLIPKTHMAALQKHQVLQGDRGRVVIYIYTPYIILASRSRQILFLYSRLLYILIYYLCHAFTVAEHGLLRSSSPIQLYMSCSHHFIIWAVFLILAFSPFFPFFRWRWSFWIVEFNFGGMGFMNVVTSLLCIHICMEGGFELGRPFCVKRLV